MGKPFATGGSGPDSFDTSGFIFYCHKEAGVSVLRRVSELVASGKAVERSELQPGDVLFFWDKDPTVAGFCGIYLGDDRYIYCSSSGDKAVIEKQLKYSTRYLFARRIG